jgi:iron complex outermembrane receptor protein
MPRYIFLFLALFMILTSRSQSFIKGRIQDSLSAPIPYCPLALVRTADSSIVKGSIANENGEFVIEPALKGSYFIKISYVGFADYYSEPIVVDSSSQLNLPPFALKSAGNTLKEVSVTAIRPTIEFKDGLVVLNVENDILSSGNTVLDLLKRIPGVSVDALNNVTVNGKTGVRFMIDGHLQQIPTSQLMTILSNMSSESVSTIALIKNPPAKYDASGTGGLINIATRKVKLKGFNGSVFESLGQGKRYGTVSGLTLNFKSDKLSVFTNIIYSNRDIFDVTQADRTLNMPQGTEFINSKGSNEAFRSVANINGGLEYNLTERSTLGLNVSGGPTSSRGYRTSNTTIDGVNLFNYDQLIYKTNNDESYNSPSVNLNFTQLLDTNGTQLTVFADYTNFLYDQTNLNRNFFFTDNAEVSPMLSYKNLTHLDFKIATQKIDFTKKLTKSLLFETGLKSSFVENISNVGLERNNPGTEIFYPDAVFSSRFDYKEKIFAGYLNFIKTIKKITLQTGLRSEQTNINVLSRTTDYTLKRNYINFFPNLSVDYKPNEKNTLQLTYSYRIDRPNYDQLNPGKIFIDQLDYGTGNPALRPQYSHNINVEFNHRNFITNSFSFTNIRNSIYGYSYTKNTSQINVDTIYNFAQKNILSYGLFIQKQLASFYRLQFSGLVAYMYSSGMINNTNVSAEIVAIKTTLNNDLFLPKGYKLQVNATYASPYRDGIQLYSQRGSLNFAIQRRFFKNQLNAVLSVNDILYTDFGSITTKLPNQSSYYREKNDTRRVRLTLTYKFGNMKIDRKLESRDEGIRVKKTKS